MHQRAISHFRWMQRGFGGNTRTVHGCWRRGRQKMKRVRKQRWPCWCRDYETPFERDAAARACGIENWRGTRQRGAGSSKTCWLDTTKVRELHFICTPIECGSRRSAADGAKLESIEALWAGECGAGCFLAEKSCAFAPLFCSRIKGTKT